MKNQEYKMTICKEDIIKIYNEEYLNGVSMVKLGEKYNVSPAYFSRWFKKLNLKARSNKENSRVYNVNHDYFEVIDTVEKAYWLGFMYADGYITKDNKIGLTLAEKDKKHIEKFRDCLDSNYEIKTYKASGGYSVGKNYCKLLITSEKMHNDLENLGVVENKTNILSKPNISECLEKYFILGYFDGDGTICLNKGKYPCYSMGFCATDDMCNFITDHLIKNNLMKYRMKIKKRKPHHIVSYIGVGGNQIVKRLMEYFYDGFNIDMALDRKYELYIKCKNKQFD